MLSSATTVHRATPVCEWPALGMYWATARSNAASAVVSRFGGACIGCCGKPVQVVWEVCGFAIFWSRSVMDVVLGNHCAQSPASVCVASPGHVMGHCKAKCSLCYVPQLWWRLHWGLRPGRAGGLWEMRFHRFVELSGGRGSTRQPQRTEPRQCVSGQPWACHGALEG